MRRANASGLLPGIDVGQIAEAVRFAPSFAHGNDEASTGPYQSKRSQRLVFDADRVLARHRKQLPLLRRKRLAAAHCDRESVLAQHGNHSQSVQSIRLTETVIACSA
jgi:hypothetical protein